LQFNKLKWGFSARTSDPIRGLIGKELSRHQSLL